MVGYRDDQAEQTAEVLAAIATHGQLPSLDRQLVNISTRINRSIDPSEVTDDSIVNTVKFLFAPVFDSESRVVAGLMLVDLPSHADLELFTKAKERLLATTETITRRLGGVSP